MNKTHANILRILGLLLITAALLIAGKFDYNEEVIHSLTDRQYQSIVEDLGGVPTDDQIVERYMKYRHHYDKLK